MAEGLEGTCDFEGEGSGAAIRGVALPLSPLGSEQGGCATLGGLWVAIRGGAQP